MEKWIKIIVKIIQAFAEKFSEPGGRGVAVGVGKYIVLVGKILRPLLLGGWFCRDAGSAKLICQVNSDFSSEKISTPQSSCPSDGPVSIVSYIEADKNGPPWQYGCTRWHARKELLSHQNSRLIPPFIAPRQADHVWG